VAGYSGTPLAKKLGIKPGTCLCALDAPAHYTELLAPLPEGVAIEAAFTPDCDLVHLFVTLRVDLERALTQLRAQMRTDAMIWVSWPKKASKVATDISEDTIRAVALPMGLVDVKVCAVDAVWSGLKLVIRRQLRSG
jgi:hypothetical protein